MRVTALLIGLSCAALAAGAAAAQSPGGRWQAYAPHIAGIPNTAWIKAEVLADDAVSQQVGAAVNDQLRLRGFVPGPGGAYAVRVELRGRGLATPVVPIPGYANVTQRLSIWPQPDQADTIYVSLMLYHQSTGQVLWQGEAVCVGLPPDSRNIVNAMVGPLMGQIGTSGQASLECRKL